ncbi:long-chain-fatty-acid-CoA ligase [Auricularia subglabra TFB-10046 SS5]|nr:long-chain-fatty-acid-CoA ligase [Auricularia subglabra TFB-10046 SS5]
MAPAPYTYTPALTLEECDRILTAPGAMFETERVVVHGQVLRVFKHLPRSLRAFWLDCVRLYGPKDYIVFENQLLTYDEVHSRAAVLACVFRQKYGVRKGDRVAIAMRNCSEYIIAFWACQLLGAVSSHVNAWLPWKPFVHCLTAIEPKVVVLDSERAKLLSPHLGILSGGPRVLVARADGGVTLPRPFTIPAGMGSVDKDIQSYKGPADEWRKEPEAHPDDNATIFFTSGTTGLPKGVLSTQRSFMHGFFGSLYSRERMLLRRGEALWGRGDPNNKKTFLIGVPLFHMGYTYQGWRIGLVRKWDKHAVADFMLREGITGFGGVPSQVLDLMDTALQGREHIEQMPWGGAPSPAGIISSTGKAFPRSVVGQGYGMTELNAAVVSFAVDDYLARPKSAGLPGPVNEILIMNTDTGKECPAGTVGEIWVRGANVMREYWRDPQETNKVLTRDGWLRTGDLAYVDDEGFLYIVDRAKDMIIRGGENIHSVMVEDAIYADDRVMEVAAVGVPDKRLGELVAVVVVPKEKFLGDVTEESVIRIARDQLPGFAVPVMALIERTPLERNAGGKILKKDLKKRVVAGWLRRQQALPVKAKL